jgi:VanZ family protein
MKDRKPTSLFLLFAAGIALIAFMHNYQLPVNTRLWKALGDAGHVPIFGCLALVLLKISNRVLGKKFTNPLFHYLAAFSFAVLTGMTSEIIQIYEPRDADINDWARDIAGASSFLSIFFLIDRDTIDLRHKVSNRVRHLIWSASVIIMIMALYQLGFVAVAYLQRDNAFPNICTFDAAWERAFWIRHDTRINVVSWPQGRPDQQNNQVGEVIFDTVTYPGFHIQEPYPNWQQYKFLKFDIYSDLDSTIGLYFRLHDIHHNKDYHDRYNNHFMVEPGLNKITISISDIQNSPTERKMDLTSIRTFGVFAYRPAEPFRLYLDNIRLE